MPSYEKVRKFIRRPIDVEFRVRDAHDFTGGELLFDSNDISEGGAFLNSAYLMEVGSRLEVSFKLDAAVPIHTIARVVWVSHASEAGRAGMGLQFIDLKPDERAAVNAFVKRHKLSQSALPDEQMP